MLLPESFEQAACKIVEKPSVRLRSGFSFSFFATSFRIKTFSLSAFRCTKNFLQKKTDITVILSFLLNFNSQIENISRVDFLRVLSDNFLLTN